MAELGAIASIVGIAAAGAKISMTLYELASTVRSGQSEVSKVAVSIATFCSVLQQLISTLEKARSARFSISAIGTTQEILDRCQEIFSEIGEVVNHLKISQDGGKSPKQTSIAHVTRVKWVFKRVKVQRLQAELESMKLTLTLMLTTLNLAEKIRVRRESGTIPTQEVRDEDEELQSIGATLIVAQQCVEDEIEDLEALREDSEGEEMPEEGHDGLSQEDQTPSQWKSRRPQSYRASLWMEVSSSRFDLDPTNRPVSWENGKPTVDTRQLFINLLKRWANCDISENMTIEQPPRRFAALQVSTGKSSSTTESKAQKSHPQQNNETPELVPIRTYIEGQIESFKETEAPEGLTLDLSNRLLTTVPGELVSLAGNQVSRLALSSNRLKSFRVPGDTFTNLLYLNLRGNKFETIPESVTKIPRLEILDLKYNRLGSLPDSLVKMKSLKLLVLDRNYLSKPPFILAFLELLQVIRVSGNPFLYLPGYERFEDDGRDDDKTIALSKELKQKLHEDRVKKFLLPNEVEEQKQKLREDEIIIEAYNDGTLLFEEDDDT